ncbi:MAG: hypothetical protein JW941_08995 [Candidatus Coatesbacteria bacterium]|nr:hypothetical protein [Candidatus Coatesbacteria bacterium]
MNARNRGYLAGLLALLLTFVMVHSVGFCDNKSRLDSIKGWLKKGPKQTGIEYSSDKRAVEAMLQALRLREEELQKREMELEVSRKSLLELQEQLKEQMETIKKAQAEVKQLLSKADAEKQERLDSLISLYGTMNAQSAASALLELNDKDPELVAAVFQALNKKRAAIILDSITEKSPATAAEITMRIGRNR